MAVQPLSPATRLRLGEPLPHQLPDRTQVAPLAHCCFHLSAYGVLATVSRSCPPPQGTSLCFTHPSAAISSKIHRSLIRRKPPNLHVLSTPPAFILSQDQTLRKIFSSVFNRLALLAWLLFIVFLCQGAAARCSARLSGAQHGKFYSPYPFLSTLSFCLLSSQIPFLFVVSC